MGSVLIFVCGRCGDPYPGPRWFTNKHQEDCHYCRDGTIGGRVEHDAAEQPPALVRDVLLAEDQCPICGGFLKGNPKNAFLFDGSMAPDGPFCPKCLILQTGRKDVGWVLLDPISHFLNTSGEHSPETDNPVTPVDAARHRAKAHLFWVNRLAGFNIEASCVARTMEIGLLLMRKVLMGMRWVPCGHCGRSLVPQVPPTDAVGRNIYPRGGSLKIHGLREDLLLTCPHCQRADSYVHLPRRGLHLWVHTERPGYSIKKKPTVGFISAMDDLPAGLRADILNARPVAPKENPQPAVEAGDDIMELARKIKKEMARHG